MNFAPGSTLDLSMQVSNDVNLDVVKKVRFGSYDAKLFKISLRVLLTSAFKHRLEPK
jgi:hypothetical protein